MSSSKNKELTLVQKYWVKITLNQNEWKYWNKCKHTDLTTIHMKLQKTIFKNFLFFIQLS